MNVRVVAHHINEVLKDPAIKYVEIVGLNHVFTIKPEKIMKIKIDHDFLRVQKENSVQLINPDHIVYVNIVYKEVIENGNR